MKFLQDYFSRHSSSVVVSARQGDGFAKRVANDFNPIHDHDSKRFCVPGDLLFAIALSEYGISESMHFRFAELLKADRKLILPEIQDLTDTKERSIEICNEREKVVLQLTLDGKTTCKDICNEQLVRRYVRFSGENFPHILLPLMREHQVMFHPTRPLVIYEQMSLLFKQTEFRDLTIKLSNTYLEVEGKRGNAWLEFDLLDQDREIGKGRKKLVLSGLRPFDEHAIKGMCDAYEARRSLVSS